MKTPSLATPSPAKPSPGIRRAIFATLLTFATLGQPSPGQAASYYDLTVLNNFGAQEYYGATPQDSDIWLLTNFAFDYKSGTNYVTGNASAGTYTAVQLSTITDGNIRLLTQSGGSRMYAVLDPTATSVSPPTNSSLATSPNNYFEWSFSGANPGTLDLSWIDSWDFQTRMVVNATGAQSPAPVTVTYGAGTTLSTQAVADKLASYVSQPGGNYTWMGTGGFSQNLSYPGTSTTPVRWITNNSAVKPNVNAASIKSFTNALDRVETQASSSATWASGTPATGPNWTSAGFRVASISAVTSPDGTVGGDMWSAYVNFTNSGSNFTMTLTDFTVYGGTGTNAAYNVVWNAVTNAGGATYSVSQTNGLLDAIWTSTPNNLTTTPAWVTNLGANGSVNLWYALYNAVASGVLYTDKFLNNEALPTWSGYNPWVAGQETYNFEILTSGAAVAGGRDGFLNGSDLIAIMQGEALDGNLVNPYFLELLASMEQTPAYLFPSQDFWQASSVGDDLFVGMQTGPLNGINVFGEDADLTWYLGSGVAVPEPSSLALCAGSLLLLLRRRPCR